jgi:hypothetical protein
VKKKSTPSLRCTGLKNIFYQQRDAQASKITKPGATGMENGTSDVDAVSVSLKIAVED